MLATCIAKHVGIALKVLEKYFRVSVPIHLNELRLRLRPNEIAHVQPQTTSLGLFCIPIIQSKQYISH